MFKNPSFIFDIICTVVWLLLAVRYARKGFLAAVVQLTGNLVSLFGARQFSGWAAGQVFEQVFCEQLPRPDRGQHLRRRGGQPFRHRGQVRGLSAGELPRVHRGGM